MISNPPFSGRTQLFEQIFSYDKPFVLLQPVQAFNNTSFVQMLCNRNDDIGIICPSKRMSFIVNNKEYKNSSTAFYSLWLCYKIPSIKGFTSLTIDR